MLERQWVTTTKVVRSDFRPER